MDPGTALAIAGVAIALPSLLETCLHGFDRFTAGRKQAETSKRFLVMLDIHKLRLLSWGRSLGLTNESGRPMNQLLNDPTYRVPIENALRLLNSLFTDGKELESRYGVKEQPYNPNQIDEPQSMFSETYDRYMQRLRKTSQLPKITKWAIHDEAKFQKMLDDINLFLSSLESLNSSLGIQPQKAVEHTIAKLSNEHDLRLVQSAALEYGFRSTGQVAHQRLLWLNPDATPLANSTFSGPLSHQSTTSSQLSTEIISPGHPQTQSLTLCFFEPQPIPELPPKPSLSPHAAAPSTKSTMFHYDETAWKAYVVAQSDASLQQLETELDKKIGWSKAAIGIGAVGSVLTAGITLVGSAAGARTTYVYRLQRDVVKAQLGRRGVVGKKEAARIEKEKVEARKRVKRWAMEDAKSGRVLV